MYQLTQKELKKQLKYNPISGVWRRNIKYTKKKRKRKNYNTIAGWENKGGYLCVSINSKTYLLNRLAWLYVHGYLPENEVDHENQNKSDNRIKNLRLINHQCNSRNCGNPKNNTSGVKGVVWDKPKHKWRVQIIIKGKCKNIGRYNSFHNAVCARLAAEQCVDWSSCDSNSPAYQYVKQNIQTQSR